MIPANTELTERHLSWLERRNPAHGRTSTYVEVVLVAAPGRDGVPEVQPSVQETNTARDRHARAASGAGQVHVRAEQVATQAREVFRLVGSTAFPPSALRNPKVRACLQELDERIRAFHGAVRGALDEYLDGNTLIMDLIAQYRPGARDIQHALSAAVLAAELAAQAWIDAGAGLGLEGDGPLRRRLAEVFLGGFLHDCGLWHCDAVPEEGHESAGARLVRSLPGTGRMAPSLVHVVLFHSDIIRLATRDGVVMVVEQRAGCDSFHREFYPSRAAAVAAVREQPAHRSGALVEAAAVRQILPVALAEDYLSRSGGFHGESPARIATRLAGYVGGGWYEHYLVALCNARGLAPRRAQVTLRGVADLAGMHALEAAAEDTADIAMYEACSIGHGDDLYSPHLVVLFAVGRDGMRRNMGYVDPHEAAFWGRTRDAGRRFYVAAGHHGDGISIQVTGFLNEDAYVNVLGEYESELRRQVLS